MADADILARYVLRAGGITSGEVDAVPRQTMSIGSQGLMRITVVTKGGMHAASRKSRMRWLSNVGLTVIARVADGIGRLGCAMNDGCECTSN